MYIVESVKLLKQKQKKTESVLVQYKGNRTLAQYT